MLCPVLFLVLCLCPDFFGALLTRRDAGQPLDLGLVGGPVSGRGRLHERAVVFSSALADYRLLVRVVVRQSARCCSTELAFRSGQGLLGKGAYCWCEPRQARHWTWSTRTAPSEAVQCKAAEEGNAAASPASAPACWSCRSVGPTGLRGGWLFAWPTSGRGKSLFGATLEFTDDGRTQC